MRPSLRIFTTSMMLRHHYQTVIRVLQVALIAISLVRPACAETSATSEPWYAGVSERLESTWNNGQTELYVPLHVHHMRFASTREKINSFNETPWGLGIGRGVYDADGDWHGLYVMEFQDSHYKPEYLAGYGYKTFWPLRDELKFGLGYVAFVTARTDIGHYTPIPAALPTLTLEYQKYSLETVYVPGGNGKGNILLFWGKIHF